MKNLDCTTYDEVWEFWRRHSRGRHVRELFPEGGKGTHRATADLANYAANKGTAIACRQRGDVQAAEHYELICDRIYNKLPAFARW